MLQMRQAELRPVQQLAIKEVGGPMVYGQVLVPASQHIPGMALCAINQVLAV